MLRRSVTYLQRSLICRLLDPVRLVRVNPEAPAEPQDGDGDQRRTPPESMLATLLGARSRRLMPAAMQERVAGADRPRHSAGRAVPRLRACVTERLATTSGALFRQRQPSWHRDS